MIEIEQANYGKKMNLLFEAMSQSTTSTLKRQSTLLVIIVSRFFSFLMFLKMIKYVSEIVSTFISCLFTIFRREMAVKHPEEVGPVLT